MTSPEKPARTFQDLRQLIGRTELARMDSLSTISFGHWDSLRTRYSYCLTVLTPLQSNQVKVSYLNAEEEAVEVKAGAYCSQLRALPSVISYEVASTEFKKKQHSTIFNKQEMLKAFAEIQRTSAPHEILQLEVIPEPRSVQAIIKNHRASIKLQQVQTYVGPE